MTLILLSDWLETPARQFIITHHWWGWSHTPWPDCRHLTLHSQPHLARAWPAHALTSTTFLKLDYGMREKVVSALRCWRVVHLYNSTFHCWKFNLEFIIRFHILFIIQPFHILSPHFSVNLFYSMNKVSKQIFPFLFLRSYCQQSPWTLFCTTLFLSPLFLQFYSLQKLISLLTIYSSSLSFKSHPYHSFSPHLPTRIVIINIRCIFCSSIQTNNMLLCQRI